MHWGIRRYQNKNGSLTSEGRAHVKEWKQKETIRRNKGYAKIEKKLLKKQSKLEIKKNNRIIKGKDTAKIDKKITSNTTNLKINKALNSAEVKKIKSMSYKDIQKSKRAKGAFAAKTALKYIGKTALAVGSGAAGIGVGLATSVSGAVSGAAAVGASVGTGVTIGAVGGGTYGLARSTKTALTSKRRFSNLSNAEKAKIYKRYYKK